MDRLLPAIFVGDAPGLDFLNSIATSEDGVVDWIGDGAGFLDWLAQARLVPETVLQQMRERALPGEIDGVADQARRLREWFRDFVRQHMGRPLDAAAVAGLEKLNRLLERDENFVRIVQHAAAGRLEFTFERRWRSPDSLLLPVGEALARFVCTADFALVKACEGHACTLLFADHTRGHARRWCSMALCGNRAKQAAHRHRVKAREG